MEEENTRDFLSLLKDLSPLVSALIPLGTVDQWEGGKKAVKRPLGQTGFSSSPFSHKKIWEQTFLCSHCTSLFFLSLMQLSFKHGQPSVEQRYD